MALPKMTAFTVAVENIDDNKINSFFEEAEEIGQKEETTVVEQKTTVEEPIRFDSLTPQEKHKESESIEVESVEENYESAEPLDFTNYADAMDSDTGDSKSNIEDFESASYENYSIGPDFEEAEEEQVDIEATKRVSPILAQEEISLGTTRSEIVQRVIDSVFTNFSLTSINLSYFGEFAINTVPVGYYTQKIGKHTFLIKEALALSLGSILPLMDKIREELRTKRSMQVPLTYPRNLEGSTMRALIITEREIQEIIKSFPDLRFAYLDQTKSIEELKLVVTTGRK